MEWRVLALLLLGALALSVGAVQDHDEKVVGHTGLERLIVRALEMLRAHMKEGRGNLTDPMHIDSRELSLKLKEITVNGSISNFNVTGHSDFELRNLTFNFADGAFLYVGLSLPALIVDGHYDVIGKLKKGLIEIPLEGSGQLEANCSNLSFEASVSLGISSKGQIVVNEFSIPSWNLDDVKFQAGGLYSGANLGNMINRILADSLPRLVKAYHNRITSFLNTFIKRAAGSFLADLHQDSPLKPPPPQQLASKDQKGASGPYPLGLEELYQVLHAGLPAKTPHAALSKGHRRGAPQTAHSRTKRAADELDADVQVELADGWLAGAGSVQLLGEAEFFEHGALTNNM